MISSMHILAQKYLDGEMTDVERSAFLDDVARDPRVAEILELETRLDMALIDDAFSIEPPAHIRSAVLETIASKQSRNPLLGFQHVTWGLAIGFFLLFAPVNLDDAMDTMRGSTTASPTVRAERHERSTALSTPTNDRASTTTASAHVPLSDDVLQTDAQPHIDQTQHAITPLHAYGIQVERPSPDVADAYMSGLATYSDNVRGSSGQLSGVVAPAVASIRYNLTDNDNIRFYVESGVVASNMQSTVFVNGLAQYTSQQKLSPFAVVGVQGVILSIPMLDRSITGSLALGIASVGPLAMADVAMSVLQIGDASLDAGVRFIGAVDLRQRSATFMQPQPFLSVSLGL